MVDRLDPRLISAGSMFGQAVALFCMTRLTDPVLLLAACAAYGFSVGNIITLPSLIMQREFPAPSSASYSASHRDGRVPRRAGDRARRPDPRRDQAVYGASASCST